MFDLSHEQIGFIAFLIITASILPYAWRILTGRADTSVTGWVIGTFTGFVLFLTYGGIGATSNIWIAVIELVDPGIVVIAALIHRGRWVWPDIYDWGALALSAIALTVHVISIHAGAETWAYASAFSADILAAIPVIMFAWREPNMEQPLAWSLSIIGISLSFFSIQIFSAEQLSLPIYQLIFSLLIVIPSARYYIQNRIPLRQWM